MRAPPVLEEADLPRSFLIQLVPMLTILISCHTSKWHGKTGSLSREHKTSASETNVKGSDKCYGGLATTRYRASYNPSFEMLALDSNGPVEDWPITCSLVPGLIPKFRS